MTAVDELKDETEKNAELSDYIDDDTNNMDKLRSKKKPGSCLNMMKADKGFEAN